MTYSYILQANEQNTKISINHTQKHPQYSLPHGRRRVMTPHTRDQKSKYKYTYAYAYAYA